MGSAWASVHVSGTIRYASPYKGTRNSGYAIWTHRQKSAYAGMASMPQASMSSANVGMMSTGRSSNRQSGSINYSATGAGAFGIITCATGIRGGVTTKQTAAAMTARASAPQRFGAKKGGDGGEGGGDIEGLPNCGCYWYYDEVNEVWRCTVCDCTITDDDFLDGPVDHCGCDPCRCPIEWDWSVLAFISLLCFVYIAYKKRQKMSNL